MKFRRAVLVACLVALALGTSPISGETRTSHSAIVVFGTSLSDPGNAFALLESQSTVPDYNLDPLSVPGAPYARGGHHFSNGATWVEQLGRSLGLAASVRPAWSSNAVGATNYAVGAARAYNDGKNVNLGDQVARFLADHGGVAPSDALYVIDMGGNDIRDAIVAFQSGGFPAAQAILQQALTSMAQHIQLLYQAGARDFLVWLPPNIGLTPAIQRLNQISPGAFQLATLLSQAFNGGVIGIRTQLSALPGIDIKLLDTYTLLNAIVANPASYGFSTVNQTCVTPDVEPFFCQNPDEYLFWDGIHPTTAGHAVIAKEALLKLMGQ
jgi:phospholipase/lecithinase/hemolysin